MTPKDDMSDEQGAQPDQTTRRRLLPRGTTPTSWRTRRWLVGGMLVAVGLTAGGGTTYAFTSTNNDGAGNGTSVVAGAQPLRGLRQAQGA
jgi:hypothetical protein